MTLTRDIKNPLDRLVQRTRIAGETERRKESYWARRADSSPNPLQYRVEAEEHRLLAEQHEAELAALQQIIDFTDHATGGAR